MLTQVRSSEEKVMLIGLLLFTLAVHLTFLLLLDLLLAGLLHLPLLLLLFLLLLPRLLLLALLLDRLLLPLRVFLLPPGRLLPLLPTSLFLRRLLSARLFHGLIPGIICLLVQPLLLKLLLLPELVFLLPPVLVLPSFIGPALRFLHHRIRPLSASRVLLDTGLCLFPISSPALPALPALLRRRCDGHPASTATGLLDLGPL